jgi:hypothetical protein
LKRLARKVEIRDVPGLTSLLNVQVTQPVVELGVRVLLEKFLKQRNVPIDNRGLRSGWNRPHAGDRQKDYRDRAAPPITGDDSVIW